MDQADLAASWGATIRARVERRRIYPPAARGAQGTVVLRLTVARDGRLIAADLARGSGNGALDDAALQAARRAGRFPAAPAALTGAQFRFDLPMTFAR
ncbi:MAG: TonB family protein [Rhodobacterales bacterium]|nr:TonB family protein [Rhodobacterales bacterium]